MDDHNTIETPVALTPAPESELPIWRPTLADVRAEYLTVMTLCAAIAEATERAPEKVAHLAQAAANHLHAAALTLEHVAALELQCAGSA